MSEPKTQKTNASVTDFIDSVPNEARRNDAFTLLKLFTDITGERPKMWGPSIIGFGQYHYKSERSSQEGDWPLTGFSPRKASLTLYIMDDIDNYTDKLAKLGKHKTSKACLYINKLADINMAVLEDLIRASFSDMKKKYS